MDIVQQWENLRIKEQQPEEPINIICNNPYGFKLNRNVAEINDAMNKRSTELGEWRGHLSDSDRQPFEKELIFNGFVAELIEKYKNKYGDGWYKINMLALKSAVKELQDD